MIPKRGIPDWGDVRIRNREGTEDFLNKHPLTLDSHDVYQLVPVSVKDETEVVTTVKKVIV